MPSIDMSIRDLENYMGTNPKPEDFDAYWDSSIQEMLSVDPDIALTEAYFHCPGADCYDLYFTGVNGARIYAQHLRPKNIQGKIPAILLFHGYSGHCGEWTDKLKFVQAGFSVFAMDARGQGGKSEDVGGVKGTTFTGHIVRGLGDPDPKKLLFRDIFLDTAELANIALSMDFVDETKVYAYGGSQGGGLTLACASLEPRVSKIAVEFPFLCDYKRVWQMNLAKDAYAELKQYFRYFDPEHKQEDEIFTKLGYIDLQYLAPRIQAETLMMTALMDTTCPPSTQYAVYNKLKSKKRHILYPDFGHEEINTAHDTAFLYFLE